MDHHEPVALPRASLEDGHHSRPRRNLSLARAERRSRDPKRAWNAEFVQIYPNRGCVPYTTWVRLIDGATEALDILAYAGKFLFDSRPDLADVLIEKAKAGTRIRLLFGDPDFSEVRRRSEEEGLPASALSTRIDIVLNYVRKAINAPGIEVRLHDTPLYNSIFRSDTTMLVNLHTYGSGTPFNPVLHLQHVPGGRIFDHYQQSFHKVWDAAKPFGSEVSS
ncbi:DUF5919 domain-containing protein [Thermocrispum agreste]|uniref:DUF5919 domain-containing protein n=1 Tax=Thermocrispum agreste TaxID=37925 RepID=UPI001B7FAA5A|nr:DUF5919 domain-containing protein [Thermocrispum agreste]